jgi:hypothetical protein
MEHERSEWHEVLARVDALETQNRRMKRAGGALLAMLSIFVLGGSVLVYDLQTYEGKFYLRDKEGQFRGAMLTDPSTGMGTLIVGTANETQDPNTGARTLQPVPNITLGYRKDNKEPIVTLFDRSGRVRVNFGVDGDGETFFETYDKTGTLLWKAKK